MKIKRKIRREKEGGSEEVREDRIENIIIFLKQYTWNTWNLFHLDKEKKKEKKENEILLSHTFQIKGNK